MSALIILQIYLLLIIRDSLECDFTSALVAGKQVRVVPVEKGRYIQGKVYVGGECLNETLLKAGYACHDYRFSPDKVGAKIERDARSVGGGLWSQGNPAPPWEVRDSKYKKTKRHSVTIKFCGKHLPQTGLIPIRQRPQKKKQ